MIGVIGDKNNPDKKDLRSPSPGHRVMSECSEGDDPKGQEMCLFFKEGSHKRGCVHARKLNAFVHCSYYHEGSK